MIPEMQKAIAALEGRGFKQSRRDANLYVLNDAGSVVESRLSPSMGFSLSGPLSVLPALLSPSPSLEEIRKAILSALDGCRVIYVGRSIKGAQEAETVADLVASRLQGHQQEKRTTQPAAGTTKEGE